MSSIECPFCAIIAGQDPARIIARMDRAIAFFPLAPAAFGHTLVAPIDHVEELRDASDDVLAELTRVAKRLVEHYRERLGCCGANLLMASGACAQQSVPHLHMHLIPRFPGDGLDTWPDLPGAEYDLDALAERLTG